MALGCIVLLMSTLVFAIVLFGYELKWIYE